MEPSSHLLGLACNSLDRFRVRAIDPEVSMWIDVFQVPVHAKVFGDAGPIGQLAKGNRVVNGVLSHVTIGCPFASNNRQKPRWVDVNGMVPRQRRCLFGVGSGGLHKGAYTDVHAQDVFPPRRLAKVLSRGLKYKIDLLLERKRLVARLVDRCVRCADDCVSVPWNSKQYPGVTGMWNHHSRIPRQK